jgi:P4 family phage/plasmid primase-like protien
MGREKGRWTIKDEDYGAFLDAMHQHLFVERLRPLNLVEKRRADDIMPGLIDLDFKYPSESSLARRFSLSHIRAFLRMYIDTLTTFFDMTKLGRNVNFYVTLRPTPYENRADKTNKHMIKDGIHVLYDLHIPYTYQLALRKKLMDLDIIGNSFGATGYINKEADIYDEACIKTGQWFFYGESKPDIPAYALAHAYSYTPATGELEELPLDSFTDRELLEKLSLRMNIEPTALVVNDDAAEEWASLVTSVSPMANAGAGAGAGATAEAALTTAVPVADPLPTLFSTGYTEDEVVLAKKLVENCLNEERAESYQTWMEVGWCLHNISPTDDMFDCWMAFSARSSKSTGNNTAALKRDWDHGWRSRAAYGNRRLTIRSLHLWAKNDNPEEYKKILEEDCIEYVLRHVDKTHTHVARLMQRLFWADYRAAVGEKETEWYTFKDNAWKKLKQAIEIKNRMSTDVAELIIRARMTCQRKIFDEKTPDHEKEFEKTRFKKLFEIEKSLYTTSFKECVLKECVGLFYDDEFDEKLNSNSYLVGFLNGVLNLRAERTLPDGRKTYVCEFREGKPDDYVSFQAGRWEPKECEAIPYVPYNPEDPDQKEIDDFMEKVFPRPELRSYMWRKLASCLEGTNKEQKYETWIGIGGNGKSKLVDLMSMSLGDYAKSLKSTVLTRKRPDGGNANPELMPIRNRRFIYMAEPDEGEPLNTSLMKQFTGEDSVEARGLFKEQVSFLIKGKIFMLCNRFPAIHAMDRGTWRRVVAVPFESKFVDEKSEEGKEINPERNIWPRDDFLDIKLRKWRVPFMSRLVHVYENEYLKVGLEPIPAIIKQESENYRALFDSFGKFKMSRIRQESGAEAQFKEIWAVYKRWSEEMGSSGGKRLTQTELQKRLNDEFGEPLDKKTYRRVRLFDDDEDIDAYDRECKEEQAARSEKANPSALAKPGAPGRGAGAGAGAATCMIRT